MRKAKAKRQAWLAWSKDEVKLLKELYPAGGTQEIAERIGRPLTAVKQKAYHMGIRTRENRRWSAGEIRQLKRLYPSETAQSIADKLGRSYMAVIVKARKLGICKQHNVWSKRELNLLKRLYPSRTAEQIGEQIGRSERATRFGIHKLGLKKRLKYEECHRVANGTKEKLCGKCKTWKSESQFGKNRRTKNGLQWQCKECESKYARKRWEEIKKAGREYLRYEDRHRVVEGIKQKFCRKCERWRNESEFYRNSSEKDGLDYQCNQCSYKPTGKSHERKRKGVRKNLRYEDRHRVVKGIKQKFCHKCKRWENESDFYKNRATKDGLDSRCKKCSYKPRKK